MNSLRFNRNSQKAFRKPLDFLSNLSRPAVQLPSNHHPKKSDGHSHSKRRNNSASSLDDTDHSDIEFYAQMEPRRSHSTQNSQSELQPPVPLIDIGSRNTSPYPRIRSAAQSDDDEDDDDEFGPAGTFSEGFLGRFLFGTWLGWQIWVGLLVFLVGGTSFGLLLMNRFVMLTGVYK
jgi:hypothetical protein